MSLAIHSKFIKNKEIKNTDEFTSIHQRGDVIIYEVVRLIDWKILFFEDHIERFLNSLKCVGFNLAISKEEITTRLALLIKSNQISLGNIRFQLKYNKLTKATEFLAYFIPHSYPTQEMYKEGVPVGITEAHRTKPNAKMQHTNLTEMVHKTLEKENVYETLLVHPKGYVTEGSRSNLFMIRDNQVFTAPIKDILPGITRKYIVQVCKDLKLNYQEKRVLRQELLTMDSLFITGTSPKALPIRNIYDKQFNVNHPILKSIIKEYDKLIFKYLENSPKFL
jgi:branched-chain amino acid aminotransferase